MASFVRMRHDALSLQNCRGTTITNSVHDHNFESPWLSDVNRGNSYISLAILNSRTNSVRLATIIISADE